MRYPETIKGLEKVQVHAYHKSFLQTLDDSDSELSDWEIDFVESTMDRRTNYSEGQVAVIQGLMDKYPRQYPKIDHYKSVGLAEEFLYEKDI